MNWDEITDSGKALGLVFLVTAGLFWVSTRYAFIRMDDKLYVEENAHMREGLTVANAKWAFASCGYALNWHPLAWLSMMGDVTIDRVLRGGAVAGDEEWKRDDSRLAHIMHGHNVLLHAANATLLLALMLVLVRGGDSGRDALPGGMSVVWLTGLALLWALHPLRVEVVCWVSERKELLSVFWMLATLILYFGAARRSILGGRGATRPTVWWFSLLTFGLALLAKPVAVSLPAAILAWDWALRGRIRWGRIVAFGALAAGVCLLTLAAQRTAMEMGGTVSGLSRLVSFFAAPVVYLRQTVWPVGLSLAYGPMANVEAYVQIALGVALVGLMAWVCIAWLWRRTELRAIGVFTVAWAYVGLVPMLGIVKVGSQEHSDRYTYWVGCGVCAGAALALGWFRPRREAIFARLGCAAKDWRDLRKLALWVLAGVLAILVYLTFGQMSNWRDGISIYRQAVSRSWDCEISGALSNMLCRKGMREEAEMWLRQCAERRPSVETYLNLAELLLMKPVDEMAQRFGGEKYPEARDLIDRVLKEYPKNKRALELRKALEKVDGGK